MEAIFNLVRFWNLFITLASLTIWLMKKTILLAICSVAAISNVFGQSLHFSPEVDFSKDESVVQIREFWQLYITAQQNDDPNIADFWGDGDIDVMKFAAGDFPIYKGYNTVQSIRRVNQNGLFEINSTYEINIPDKQKPILFMLYKVYVSKESGVYKLHNYFDVAKRSMNVVKSDNIELYFAQGRVPVRKKVNDFLRFYNFFTEKYEIPQTHKITVVVARSIDEAWSALGVPYTAFRSEDPNAGLAIAPSIILTTREDHIHELVHAILSPIYPNIPQWIEEGIATYYGGVAGREFTEYIDLFYTHIEELDRTNDFFNQEFLNSQIAPNISAQYILGAIIIDYVITMYGDGMLSDILLCTNTEEILKLLNINRDNSYGWINEQRDRY